MPQPNVEIAKRAIEAFNAREIETFMSLVTPDFEWSPSMSAIENKLFVGPAGVREYFAAFGDAWERFQIVPGEFREATDLVLMLGRLEGHGRMSGVEVDSPLGMAFDLRSGMIVRIRGFLDHAEALAATGLGA
jgi:ketosteroid isomerase-like protein